MKPTTFCCTSAALHLASSSLCCLHTLFPIVRCICKVSVLLLRQVVKPLHSSFRLRLVTLDWDLRCYDHYLPWPGESGRRRFLRVWAAISSFLENDIPNYIPVDVFLILFLRANATTMSLMRHLLPRQVPNTPTATNDDNNPNNDGFYDGWWYSSVRRTRSPFHGSFTACSPPTQPSSYSNKLEKPHS